MDRQTKTCIIAGLFLAVLAVAGNYARFSEPPAAATLALDGYRLAAADTSYEIEPMDGEFLDLLGAREVSFRTYRAADGKPVWIFMGYFDRQKEGSQVHSPKHCYPGAGWSILAESVVASPWGEDQVKRLVVSDGNETRVVYYWFQTADRVLNNVFALKYYLTSRALLRHRQDVVFARVSTALEGKNEMEARRAEGLLGEYSRNIQHAIGDLYRRRDVAN